MPVGAGECCKVNNKKTEIAQVILNPVHLKALGSTQVNASTVYFGEEKVLVHTPAKTLLIHRRWINNSPTSWQQSGNSLHLTAHGRLKQREQYTQIRQWLWGKRQDYLLEDSPSSLLNLSSPQTPIISLKRLPIFLPGECFFFFFFLFPISLDKANYTHTCKCSQTISFLQIAIKWL